MQPKYLKLRDIWYDKLDKAGFIDLECHIPAVYLDFPLLDDSAGELAQAVRRAQESGIDEYFRRVSSYLHDGTFRNAQERVLWALHVQGLSFSQIAALMRSKGLSRSKVYRTIRQIRRRMESEGTDRCVELGNTEAIDPDTVRKLEILREFAAFGEGFLTRPPWERERIGGYDDDE